MKSCINPAEFHKLHYMYISQPNMAIIAHKPFTSVIRSYSARGYIQGVKWAIEPLRLCF